MYPNPGGDTENLANLATSTNALSTEVKTPPLGKSKVLDIFPAVVAPNPQRCGSELSFLWIPLNING